MKGQLPLEGHAELLVGDDEQGEAKLVADEIQRLCKEGHPDIEGPITPASFAVLGRTRYTLLAVEKEFDLRRFRISGASPHSMRTSWRSLTISNWRCGF